MIIFVILTVVSVAGILLRQSALRYSESAAEAGGAGEAATFSWSGYGKWVRRRLQVIWSKDSWWRGWDALKSWTKAYYPGWLGWIFAGLLVSVAYQAASGFAFGLFSPRGMFGLPLIGHMAMGGLFALSLAAMLFWRARAYPPGTPENGGEGFACPVFKKLTKPAVRKMLFWTFAFFGFIQVASALGSMLPIFTFQAQLALIMIHRFSALALLLSAIVFADLAFLPSAKKN